VDSDRDARRQLDLFGGLALDELLEHGASVEVAADVADDDTGLRRAAKSLA
jgi:hypothetical protein